MFVEYLMINQLWFSLNCNNKLIGFNIPSCFQFFVVVKLLPGFNALLRHGVTVPAIATEIKRREKKNIAPGRENERPNYFKRQGVRVGVRVLVLYF